MTLFQRIRRFLSPNSSVAISVTDSSDLTKPSAIYAPKFPEQPQPEPSPAVPPQLTTPLISLPDWLTDEESLRDEGVLFGLSTARPDGKLAQIRAYFSQQAAPLEEQIEQYTEKISELNLFIEQRENKLLALNDQVSDLRNQQPATHNLVQHLVSLALSVVMSVGNFYLIDATLRPVFANRWIAVGVFLAGMFHGVRPFSVKGEPRPTSRQLITDVGLPLATAFFVLALALQTQSFGRAISLFVFVFFLFLLAGRLLLTTLSDLQADQAIIVNNRQLREDKAQGLPLWQADSELLTREIDTIRTQKWPLVTTLNHMQTALSQLNAKRDVLVNLFLSEFELARSLRDQLTEQQRKQIMDYGL